MNVYIGANSEKRKRETGIVNETERKGLPGWIEVGGLREEHGDTREENQEIKEERGETRERERKRKVVIYLAGGDKAAICFHVRFLGID